MKDRSYSTLTPVSTMLVLVCALLTAVFLVHLYTTCVDSNKKQRDEIASLQYKVSTLQTKVKSFGELSYITPERRAIVLAISYTETRCRYNKKHRDKKYKGIGGINPKHYTGKAPINSLSAIEEDINKRIAKLKPLNFKTDNELMYAVIKDYKGASKNLVSTNETFELYVGLKNIYKEK